MGSSFEIVVEFTHPLSDEEAQALSSKIENRQSFLPGRKEKLDLVRQDSPEIIEEGLNYSGFSVEPDGHLVCDYDVRQPLPSALASKLPLRSVATYAENNGWSELAPHGPLPLHVVTLLTLMASPLVKRVWNYVREGGVRNVPITRSEALQLLDKYVEIGLKPRGSSNQARIPTPATIPTDRS
ncbi:TPA: hypothetical protein ACKP9S_002828 [Pseudomonas aeruginosa]